MFSSAASLLPALLVAAVAGCGAEATEPTTLGSKSQALSVSVLVQANDLQQRISGFGASSAWYTTDLSEEQADQFFSPDVGLGLSLLRLRIAPDGNSVELKTARQAANRGVRLWAAPWSPPGAWKTNGSELNGGSLLPEHYQDWADRLAQFAKARADEGIPLVALSTQNEPNFSAEWESCRWELGELVTFVRDYLGPTLHAVSPATGVMAPEAIDWRSMRPYADFLLDDRVATEYLGIIATHSYGNSSAAPYPAAQEAGKELWETEISNNETSPSAPADVAAMIHQHLTVGNANAWHYWWMISDGESSLMKVNVMTQKAYALGNFSKFVRPGFYRVSTAPDNPAGGVFVSAFKGPRARLVIVAVNQNTAEVSQSFTLAGVTPSSLTPWITSDTLSLEPQPAIAVDLSFNYDLPPISVVTFVSEPTDTGGSDAGGAGGSGAGVTGGSGAGVTGGSSAGGAGGSGAEAGVGGELSGGAAGESENGGAGNTSTGGDSSSSGGGSHSQAGLTGTGGLAASGGHPPDFNTGGSLFSGGTAGSAAVPRGGSATGGSVGYYRTLPRCDCAVPGRPAKPGSGEMMILAGCALLLLRRSERRPH